MVTLRELADRRAEAYDTGWSEYRRADVALREQLLDMAGNALLADLHRGFVEPFRAASAEFDDAEPTRDDPDAPETENRVRAVQARDPDAAGAAAGRGIDNALRVLRLLLQVVDMGPVGASRRDPSP